MTLFIFFLSGVSALLYQAIWQRILTFMTGVDIYSVTITVAAFMAGLGFGSMAGGALADRLSKRQNYALFAGAELSIALFAIMSKFLFYDLLYTRFHFLIGNPLLLYAVLFACILWPTFFMGLSLPLLSKGLTAKLSTTPQIVGSLYGVNTLGAALGAILSTHFLAKTFGFEPSLAVGAAINFLCGLWGLVLFFTAEDSKGISQAPLTAGKPAHSFLMNDQHFESVSFSFSHWLAIYGLSGFVALALEILWFRILSVMMKSNSFTFSYLLFSYLLGYALGILASVRWVERIRKPTSVFFMLQSGIVLYAAVSLGFLVHGLGRSFLLEPLWSHLSQYESTSVNLGYETLRQLFLKGVMIPEAFRGHVLRCLVYLGLPLFLISIPTFMMGLSFPLLQKIVQKDIHFLGRRVGWLQAANIFGSMTGAILVSFVGLQFFGTSWTLKAVVGLGAIFLFFFCKTQRIFHGAGKKILYAAMAAVIAAVVHLVPDSNLLWAKLHGASPESLISDEDETGLSILRGINERFDGRTLVFVNGKGESWIPYGGIHTLLGFLPALIHPLPEEILIIGLGSGDTLFSAGGRKDVRRIDCIEIIASQLRSLRVLNQRRPYQGLKQILEDSRFNHIIGDGREFLLRTDNQYDIIEADALRPNSAYSGHVYSYEYFQLLKSRLKKGGFAVTWAPTSRIANTFTKVFPHVLAFASHPKKMDESDQILIGSNEPIGFDIRELQKRTFHLAAQEYYRQAGVDVRELAEKILEAGPVDLSGVKRDDLSDINTDLFPKDEFQYQPHFKDHATI